MSDRVEVEVAGGGVAVARINNPPLNLLSTEVKRVLLARGDELASAWPGVRVVVLAGAGGRAFSAGADLREFPERIRTGRAREASAFGHRLAGRWLSLPQITLAMIRGVCLGGGLEVALTCDLRVASAGSQFGFPEVRRGWFPGNGGTQILPEIVGRQAARRLLLTGEIVDARTAHAIGLVDRLVPDEEVETVALEWARNLADRPAQAVSRLKRLLRPDLASGLALEEDLFAEVFATEDAREGLEAFFQKRSPAFRHR